MSLSGKVQFVNPEALNKNPAFTNVAVVTGTVKTVYVGGQDAVDATGNIVGKGDIKAQTEQVLKTSRSLWRLAALDWNTSSSGIFM
jgi:enamine deaminase RidA (YjgF/YER057c/UK114 family)